jgi:cysteine desulfurase/selenocysteine lyase
MAIETTERRVLDAAAIRRDFPILEREINGHPLVYLDSASTSQKPSVVIDAVADYYREYNANVHRGIYTIGEQATAAYEAARVQVARFINAPDSHEVVYTRNATEAINLVAYSWGRRNVGRGDQIILTEMEHHANLVPWQLLVQEVDGDLEFIPITDDGILRLDVFEVLLRLKPKLVAFTHVSNTLGTINPVREMTEMAHAAGALVLVDGAQAVPHLKVDVQELGVDFYAFSGHKMLAPMGSGALWARRELLEAMPPFLTGGSMVEVVTMSETTYMPPPQRFEAGTQMVAQTVGLHAAVGYLSELGMDGVAAHEAMLARRLLDGIAQIPQVRVLGPADAADRLATVAFAVDGVHPHDVGQYLDDGGIAVRVGHHCAQPLHRRLGVASSARASAGIYTTTDDVDAFLERLADVRAFFVGGAA